MLRSDTPTNTETGERECEPTGPAVRMAQHCHDALAVLMTALEGVGDEELYEHACSAYHAAETLLALLYRRCL